MKINASLSSSWWRPAVIAIAFSMLTYVLYFHNIRHLLPGFSSMEIASYRSAADWHTILHNPVNAPYKLAVWLTILLGHHGYIQTRLIAASFAVSFILLFYAIVNHWYGNRTALLASLFFASSNGLLHGARLGSADILQMSLLVYLAAIIVYRKFQNRRQLVVYMLCLLMAALLYIPGMIWVELLGLVLMRQGVVRRLNRQPYIHTVLSSLLSVLVTLPLIIAAISHTSVALATVGFPQHLQALRQFPNTVLHTLASIVLKSTGDPTFFVGHAPFLSVVGVVLLAFGVFAYAREIREPRHTFLAVATLLSVMLVGLNGSVSIALLLPILYLFVARGLHELLQEWLRVFPRNPIAKYTGIGLVCVMIGFAVLYQTRAYFVAWPHNKATEAAFSRPQP